MVLQKQNTSNLPEDIPWNDLLGHHQLGLLLSLTARFQRVRLFSDNSCGNIEL
jgi:hypothetical protein